MAYTIRTFRGYQTTASYLEAFSMALNQLDEIKASGFEMSVQWARIEDGFGLVKLLYPCIDGGTNVTPWWKLI